LALLLDFGFAAQFGFEALTTHAPRANRRCPLTVFFTARLANSHGQAGLTRHKISDRWRERVWLQVECGSHLKRERGTASGSLHRMVRPLA
jgi:hypothetical protein